MNSFWPLAGFSDSTCKVTNNIRAGGHTLTGPKFHALVYVATPSKEVTLLLDYKSLFRKRLFNPKPKKLKSRLTGTL